MSNQIVLVNVSQTLAPAPSTLQKTGAFISQGGTTLPPGTYSLLTTAATLGTLLQSPINLASLTSSGLVATATLESSTISSGTYNTTTGLVTLTLAASIGVVPGVEFAVSGATGTGSVSSIDGTWTAATGTSGTTVEFFVATGLTMTITGGAIEGVIGLANGATFVTTISGAQPAGYNGLVLATVASSTTFTYALATMLTSPATGTPAFTPNSAGELVAMNTTFWAQGSQQSVYVLELGPGTPAAGVTALSAFITANPKFFYSYLLPRSWAGESTYLTFLASYEASNAEVYFFTTMTTSNYTSFTALEKCVLGLVEAPGIPTSEFSLASVFWVTLHYNPSSTNQVPPLAFSIVFGVTPYPQAGNATLFATLRAANINIIGIGSEGGLSNTIVFWGHLLDGNPFNYWYSIDWLQINLELNLANTIINGSNGQPPLYYDQDGINRLQASGQQTISNWISYGLGLGNIILTELPQSQFIENLENEVYIGNAVLNAEPFLAYTTENPSDYTIGKYAGLTAVGTPLRGFENVIFNLNIQNFVG